MFILLIVYLVSSVLSFLCIINAYFKELASGTDITVKHIILAIIHSLVPIWNFLPLGFTIAEAIEGSYSKLMNAVIFKGYEK